MAKKIENPPAPVEAEIVAPPMGEIEEPEGSTPGERINYHVGMAQHHGRQALAHLIMAGWELAREKAALGYGAWGAWCDKNLHISKLTADRYIMFYARTAGAARESAGTPLSKKPTVAELAAATMGMEQKSATRAMIDLDIIRRPANWGGAGRGQGRKAKGAAEEAAELDEIANNPALLYAAIKGPLDELWKLHRERDVFHRIGVNEFRDVASVIFELNGVCSKELRRRGMGV